MGLDKDTVREYVKDFQKMEQYNEFYIALLIYEFLDESDVGYVTDERIKEVQRIIGNRDYVFEDDLRYKMIELNKSEEVYYYLDYSYDSTYIKIFIQNEDYAEVLDSIEKIYFNDWNAKNLKKLNNEISTKIDSLIEQNKSIVPNLNFSTDEKVALQFNIFEMISRKINIDSKLNMSIKEWYLKQYPQDSLGNTLSSDTTFSDLNNFLDSNSNKTVYSLLGGQADSVIRERCFENLAIITEQEYKTIFNKHLNVAQKETEIDREYE